MWSALPPPLEENGDKPLSLPAMAASAAGSHSFASTAGDAAADELYARLGQRIAAPDEWSLDYVEHHQMMGKVAAWECRFQQSTGARAGGAHL